MTDDDERALVDTFIAECRRIERAWMELLDHALRLRRIGIWLCVANVIMMVALLLTLALATR